MRISDWSSDVCSSDLRDDRRGRLIAAQRVAPIDVPGRRIATHQLFIGLADSDGATYISGPLPDDLGIMTHIAPSARGAEFWQGSATKISLLDCSPTHHFRIRSEEHKSALQSLLCTSYAVLY